MIVFKNLFCIAIKQETIFQVWGKKKKKNITFKIVLHYSNKILTSILIPFCLHRDV